MLVYTGPIDSYFAQQGMPKLEYRSLKFEEIYHPEVRQARGGARVLVLGGAARGARPTTGGGALRARSAICVRHRHARGRVTEAGLRRERPTNPPPTDPLTSAESAADDTPPRRRVAPQPEGEFFQEAMVVNYPSPDVPFTRIVEYKHVPNQPENVKRGEVKGTLIAREYSSAEGDPYYPVPNPANAALYEKCARALFISIF